MRSNAAAANASSKGDGSAIEALAVEVARLRAENAELVGADGRSAEGARDGALDSFEVTVRIGPGAPATARDAVTRWLTGLVPDHVRDDARLLISELVTNALHAGLAADTPLWISGRLTHGVVWLQVGNPGRAGADRPARSRPADRRRLGPAARRDGRRPLGRQPLRRHARLVRAARGLAGLARCGGRGRPPHRHKTHAESRRRCASGSDSSFFSVWFSICRIRSRVTLNARPTSSSVYGRAPVSPKRISITSRSR